MTPARFAPPARLLFLLLLVAIPLAGCIQDDDATGDRACAAPTGQAPASIAPAAILLPAPGPDAQYVAAGFNGTHWPDLHGAKVTLLDHGAFEAMFGPTKLAFEALTNGTLEHIAAADAGDALNRAIREKDDPSFDLVYGLDNVYLGKAVAAGALQPYTPLLAPRVNSSYVFFDGSQPWPATPADHGYIAVNVDPRSGFDVQDLAALCVYADRFATQDPRFSSPGLGFFLATVASYPEGSAYDWHDYWNDLLDGGAKVRADWTTAYTQDFTGGYGQYEAGFAGTKPVVTSYTTSPAYEAYYGATELNQLVLAPLATFAQVETVALAANAPHTAAAQAFIEFVLTDALQDLHAQNNAVYPVVDGIDVAKIYAGLDPAPGSFVPASLTSTQLAGVEEWIREWTDLYEAHQA